MTFFTRRTRRLFLAPGRGPAALAPQVEEDQVEEDQVEEDQVEEDQVEEDQVEEDQVEGPQRHTVALDPRTVGYWDGSAQFSANVSWPELSSPTTFDAGTPGATARASNGQFLSSGSAQWNSQLRVPAPAHGQTVEYVMDFGDDRRVVWVVSRNVQP